MNGQMAIAKVLLDTFNKGAIADLRTFLNSHQGVTKWLLTSDYCIKDADRSRDALAFTLIPYDAEFPDLKSDAVRGLPRDLKKIKALSQDGISFVRDPRRFHVVVMLDRARKVFVDHSGQKATALTVAREAIEGIVTHVVNQGRGEEVSKIVRAFREKGRSNGFNVRLFGDQLIVSAILGLLSALLVAEAGAKLIGWFSDRDNMVDFGEGIFWVLATEATHGIAEWLGAETAEFQLTRAGPDPTAGGQALWFDDFLRIPDHLAGALSAWDSDANLVPGEHEKYVQLVRDVVADAENILVLDLSLTPEQVSAHRLKVSRTAGNAESEGEPR